jgi:hypothetical protein
MALETKRNTPGQAATTGYQLIRGERYGDGEGEICVMEAEG